MREEYNTIYYKEVAVGIIQGLNPCLSAIFFIPIQNPQVFQILYHFVDKQLIDAWSNVYKYFHT